MASPLYSIDEHWVKAREHLPLPDVTAAQAHERVEEHGHMPPVIEENDDANEGQSLTQCSLSGCPSRVTTPIGNMPPYRLTKPKPDLTNVLSGLYGDPGEAARIVALARSHDQDKANMSGPSVGTKANTEDVDKSSPKQHGLGQLVRKITGQGPQTPKSEADEKTGHTAPGFYQREDEDDGQKTPTPGSPQLIAKDVKGKGKAIDQTPVSPPSEVKDVKGKGKAVDKTSDHPQLSSKDIKGKGKAVDKAPASPQLQARDIKGKGKAVDKIPSHSQLQTKDVKGKGKAVDKPPVTPQPKAKDIKGKGKANDKKTKIEQAKEKVQESQAWANIEWDAKQPKTSAAPRLPVAEEMMGSRSTGAAETRQPAAEGTSRYIMESQMYSPTQTKGPVTIIRERMENEVKAMYGGQLPKPLSYAELMEHQAHVKLHNPTSVMTPEEMRVPIFSNLRPPNVGSQQSTSTPAADVQENQNRGGSRASEQQSVSPVSGPSKQPGVNAQTSKPKAIDNAQKNQKTPTTPVSGPSKQTEPKRQPSVSNSMAGVQKTRTRSLSLASERKSMSPASGTRIPAPIPGLKYEFRDSDSDDTITSARRGRIPVPRKPVPSTYNSPSASRVTARAAVAESSRQAAQAVQTVARKPVPSSDSVDIGGPSGSDDSINDDGITYFRPQERTPASIAVFGPGPIRFPRVPPPPPPIIGINSTSSPKKWGREGIPNHPSYRLDFMNFPPDIMKRMFKFMLLVNDFVVPYQYAIGPFVVWQIPIPVDRKPMVNIIAALVGRRDHRKLQAAEWARDILYRENRFAWSYSMDLAFFASTVGPCNLTRMQYDKFALASDFMQYQPWDSAEFQWYHKWVPTLKVILAGRTSEYPRLGCTPTRDTAKFISACLTLRSAATLDGYQLGFRINGPLPDVPQVAGSEAE